MDVCCIIFSLLAQECEAPPSVQTFYELLSPWSSQHAKFTVLWGENALLWSNLKFIQEGEVARWRVLTYV